MSFEVLPNKVYFKQRNWHPCLFVLVVIHRDPTWDRIQSPHTSEPMKRKWEARLKQIEERASHYEREPLSLVYRPRLSKPEEPPSIWKLFHRQTEAFNFVKSCKEVIFLIFFLGLLYLKISKRNLLFVFISVHVFYQKNLIAIFLYYLGKISMNH